MAGYPGVPPVFPPPGYPPVMPGYPQRMPGYSGAPGYPPGYPQQPGFPPGFQGGPPPNTVVYVGKISPLLDDELMRLVLEACGAVRSWKRSTDPSTGAPKRFGFAEFESAEGVQRCVRVLRDREVAGAPLLVNLSQAAQRFLDFHLEQLRSRRAVLTAAPQPSDGAAAAPAPAGDAADATAEAQTLALITELLRSRLGDEETVRQRFAASMESEQAARPPPPPPPPPLQAGRPPPAFVSGGALPAAPPGRGGDADGLPAAPPPFAPGPPAPTPEEEAELARRAERERERERERRERERREESRREELRVAERERAREREEAERARELGREAERQRDAARQRARELARDLDTSGASSDDSQPLGRAQRQLKRRRDVRGREERRRRRKRELEEDEAERRREEQQAEAARRLRAEQAERAAREPPRAVPPVAAPPMPLAPPRPPSPPPQPPSQPEQDAFQPGAAPITGMALLKRAAAKKPLPPPQLFGQQEEAEAVRCLVPIQYTEEELRASLVNEYAAAEEAEGDGADGDKRRGERELRRRREKEEREAKKSLLAIIEAIPTTRAQLFLVPIDWPAFDKAGLADTVARWAAKKVQELLGEAEPSLVEFITQQTKQHVAPDALLTELQAVLDEEAEAFVIKLWRLIIFECAKAAQAQAA